MATLRHHLDRWNAYNPLTLRLFVLSLGGGGFSRHVQAQNKMGLSLLAAGEPLKKPLDLGGCDPNRLRILPVTTAAYRLRASDFSASPANHFSFPFWFACAQAVGSPRMIAYEPR